MSDPKTINPDLATRIYSDVNSGNLIGERYKILESIACGGMGKLYRALDTNLQREVALKQLHAQYSTDEMFRQRFYREAKAMARLNHENIIQVFDFFSSDESLYLVMEYFPEQDLGHWKTLNQSFPIQEVLNIAIMIGSALVCAHEGGVVHRDIKPANILYSPTRGAKLTDFGIAGADGDQTLTRAGDVMGSPKYMSPEQAAGLTLDGRSDLFSLGIMLFELATGAEPYQPMTTTAIGAALIYDTNEIELQYPPNTPQPIIRLVKSVVRRNPDNRLQDARAFCALVEDTALALDIKLGTTTIPPRSSVPPAPQGSKLPGKRHGIVGAIGLALFVTIGAAIWLIQQPTTDTSPAATTPSRTPPPAVDPENSAQDEASANILPTGSEKQKEATSEIRRAVVRALGEVKLSRKVAIDAATKIFPDDQWRKLQTDHMNTLLEIDQANELFKTDKYAAAQIGFQKSLEQIPPLVDRWISLRKEAEKSLEVKQKEIERQRLAAIETEKASRKAARQARHEQLTEDDINEVRSRLTYLQQAFQNKDLLALQTLSELDERHARFFQKLFNIYRQVRAELVVSKVDRDLAVGKITITSLVNQDGNTVEPGSTWRIQTIHVPRVDAKWKTPVWQ